MSAELSPEIIKRFWDKVDKQPDKCWLWTASKRNKGYGAFAYTLNGKTIHDRAHRFSYQLYKGEIPKGLSILHSCDNPACVNPDHLSPGTISDNNQDMVRKGRHVKGGTYLSSTLDGGYERGEVHHNAKLTESIVIEIRQSYALGKSSHSQLAKRYQVGVGHINRIIKRKAWKHVS